MNLRKGRNIALAVWAIGCVALILSAQLIPGERAKFAGMIVGVVIMAVGALLLFQYWRCPHCNEVLPIPHTKYENFVHMCDYLASRKCILFEFDENGQIIG